MPRMLGAAAFVLLVVAPAHAASGAGSQRVHAVAIDGTQYVPQTIEVQVGDTVVWKNKDPFPHTVTAEDRSFDSHVIAAGRSWKWKARRKGVFPYVCTLHPNMKGQLVVK